MLECTTSTAENPVSKNNLIVLFNGCTYCKWNIVTSAHINPFTSTEGIYIVPNSVQEKYNSFLCNIQQNLR